MSQAEERSTPPQKAGYRAPGATVLGSVPELTGGGDGDYQDYNGGFRGLAAGRDDEQASQDDAGDATPKPDEAEE